MFGYSEITRQYYERYGLPIMHTETNMREGPTGQEAVQWLWKEWANVLRIRNVGIPTVGFTWYSLTDQIDWDTALRENATTASIRSASSISTATSAPVGRAYKKLIADWRRAAARLEPLPDRAGRAAVARGRGQPREQQRGGGARAERFVTRSRRSGGAAAEPGSGGALQPALAGLGIAALAGRLFRGQRAHEGDAQDAGRIFRRRES